MSAAVRPLPSLTVAPALSIAEETYEGSDARSQALSASLSVSWRSVLEGVDLSVSGSYARSRARDDPGDATTINAVAGLVWQIHQAGPTGTSPAFEAGSNRYFDAATRTTGHADVYGVVTLRISAV